VSSPHRLPALALLVLSPLAIVAPCSAALEISFDVQPRVAQVGDALEASIQADLPPDSELQPNAIGPELGPFNVIEGSWSGPQESETGLRWSWRGRLVAFRTGELEVPPITLAAHGPDGEERVTTGPIRVTIESVLSEADLAEAAPALSDLKPPASIRPAYGPLWTALSVVSLLLVGAGLLWWLHRRYAARLAAVPVPDDPFHRTPPHVWVYGELKRLLEQRLPEQGLIDAFYAELSRILKQYLSGRYRVELIERTSVEVPALLLQAGAGKEAISRVNFLLAECDQVKFARHVPDSEACRTAVERVYRIVDMTRPAGLESVEPEQGAA